MASMCTRTPTNADHLERNMKSPVAISRIGLKMIQPHTHRLCYNTQKFISLKADFHTTTNQLRIACDH